MSLDWRAAYFQQARSDYDMLLKLLKEEDIPLCHCLHYLQMTTEKLAKGFRTRPGAGPYTKTHTAFATFVRKYAVLNSELQIACRIPNDAQYALYLNGLSDLAKKIEELSPDGGDHPNPEYPWQQGAEILVPVSYPFADLDLYQQTAKMAKLLKFITRCFEVT